ncbi:MAG: hypothetical protein KDD45_02640, partial [Bdellovibrionales bacterium]|nr:hypothetical protein [Bdellovibrionales bacterium]
TSRFPSGQMSEEDLDAKKIRSETISTFQVKWGKNDFQFKHNELVKEIQVADQGITKISSPIYLQAKFQTKIVARVAKKEVIKILSIDNYWALIEKLDEKVQGYIPVDYLESFSEDKGFGYTATSLYLKDSTAESGKIITTIPQKERIKIIFWDHDKLYVDYKKYQGYIRAELVFMKADFATMALHYKKGWLDILYREGSNLRTKNHELIPISDFKAYITDKYRAFSLVNKTNGPKIRSRLEIKNLAGDFWNISLLSDHGEVWWKKSMESEETLQTSETLSTQQILRRKIYSMAFYPGSKVKGLISAEGVFKTVDGKHWAKIDFFKDENWPVAITQNKTWIIGQYRSLNEGKSFEPFIRWDYLSKKVEETLSVIPKFMKITKLESEKDNQLNFWMDIGSKRIKMRYSLNSDNWSILPRSQ